MLQRQVYRMPRAGSINNLTLQTELLPEPASGEVTVQVHAIGLNFADIFAMQGLYSATPPGSFIPGLEYSGVILAVGPGVKNLKPGDKVMGVTKFGGYASHLNSDHRYVIPLPSGWSFEQGAGFLVQGLTAYYALIKLGDLQPGMAVLIHSAAGGVGILSNRICKKVGAYTIGSIGSPTKMNFLLKEEDYDKVLVRDKNLLENLQNALNGRPLLLVLECIGGSVFEQSWAAMSSTGRMVTYGSASFASHGARPNYLKLLWQYLRRPKIDPLRLPTQNKSLMGFNLIYLYEQTTKMLDVLTELMGLELKPQHIGHVFKFEELKQAIHLFQSGASVGKVVAVIDHR